MFSLLILILASELGQSSKEERAIAIRTIMFWRIHVSVGQTVHWAYSQKAYAQISVVYLICLVKEKIKNRSEYEIIWVLKGCASADSQFVVFYVNISQVSKISAVQQWNSSCSTWRAGGHTVRESQDISSWKWPLVSSQPQCPKQDQLRAIFSGPV